MNKKISILIDLLQKLDINETINHILVYLKDHLKDLFPIKKILFIKYNFSQQQFKPFKKMDIETITELLQRSFKEKSIIIDSSEIVIPLLHHDKPLAFIYIESNKRINTKIDIQALDLEAKLCSLIYYNVNLYNLAVKDPLTRIYNMRYFNYKLKEYFQDYQTKDECKISIVMLDIDHFKHYNDKYGHQTGDKILQTITKTINAMIDDDILFARYGGEEFIFLLPNYGIKEALGFAEKIRNTIQQMRISTKEFFWRITVSLGVSTYPDDTSNPIDLINCADMSLYYSKKNGRNKVSAYAYDVKK
ncbi:MAG: GGDEF domain-containing protein [Spirochaetes bacterium]|nr:GGDEF domain-containing protein [Spirochaetota bacterium]